MIKWASVRQAQKHDIFNLMTSDTIQLKWTTEHNWIFTSKHDKRKGKKIDLKSRITTG